MDTVLYLGRFQPFHKGHWWMLEQLLSRYKVKVAIGSAQPAQDDPQNPYDVAVRESMIRSVAEAHGVTLDAIYHVPDIPQDDLYVAHVQALCGSFDVVASAEEDWTRRLFAAAGYPCVYLGRHGGISATEVRRRKQMGENWRVLVPPTVISILEQVS